MGDVQTLGEADGLGALAGPWTPEQDDDAHPTARPALPAR
jgi:hypothetical protein